MKGSLRREQAYRHTHSQCPAVCPDRQAVHYAFRSGVERVHLCPVALVDTAGMATPVHCGLGKHSLLTPPETPKRKSVVNPKLGGFVVSELYYTQITLRDRLFLIGEEMQCRSLCNYTSMTWSVMVSIGPKLHSTIQYTNIRPLVERWTTTTNGTHAKFKIF